MHTLESFAGRQDNKLVQWPTAVEMARSALKVATHRYLYRRICKLEYYTEEYTYKLDKLPAAVSTE
jgi:hypothetical protein